LVIIINKIERGALCNQGSILRKPPGPGLGGSTENALKRSRPSNSGLAVSGPKVSRDLQRKSSGNRGDEGKRSDVKSKRSQKMFGGGSLIQGKRKRP